MTAPITDLAQLLSSMSPRLDPRTFVFAKGSASDPQASQAIMTFQEAEGLTLIVEATAAEGLETMFRCRMITLEVHSALDAVGFLAHLLPKLAEAGMGVNPVSAFFHDHLFVPEDRAEDAVAILKAVAAEAVTA